MNNGSESGIGYRIKRLFASERNGCRKCIKRKRAR